MTDDRIISRMQPRPDHVERKHTPNIYEQNISEEEGLEIVRRAEERDDEIRDDEIRDEWDEEWKASSAAAALECDEERREEKLRLSREGRGQI